MTLALNDGMYWRARSQRTTRWLRMCTGCVGRALMCYCDDPRRRTQNERFSTLVCTTWLLPEVIIKTSRVLQIGLYLSQRSCTFLIYAGVYVLKLPPRDRKCVTLDENLKKPSLFSKCLWLTNMWLNKKLFFHPLKKKKKVCLCVCGNTGQPVIRGCYSEWRVHIFCLCGWQSVYWKSCSLWAHVAACAVSKSAPTEPLKCKRGARESVFVELWVWVGSGGWLYLCVCARACVSLILFGELCK